MGQGKAGRRGVIVAGACALAAGVIGFGIAANDSDSGLHLAVDNPKTAATKEPLTHAEKRRKRLERNGEIAKLGRGSGFTSSSVMWPQTNGWGVCDQHDCTEVQAGAVAQNHSTGWFLVSRYQRPTGTASHLPGGSVKIPGSGPVTITKAPLGAKVRVWAQRRGNLRFRGKTGVTGTLHLKDVTATLSTGAVIHATNRP